MSMPGFKSLREGWEFSHAEVLSTGAPPEQLENAKLAFYAGAVVVNNIILNMEHANNPEKATATIQALQDELKEHAWTIAKEIASLREAQP